MIKGTTVLLYEQTKTGEDPFGAPIYTEKAVSVPDVLIGEPSTDDITTSTQLYGKTIRFMLGIPKGDNGVFFLHIGTAFVLEVKAVEISLIIQNEGIPNPIEVA